MKTIRLTEESLKRMVAEAVKQITAGGPLEGEINYAWHEVSREIKNVVSYLDELAGKYIDKSDETGEELYESFGSKLYTISENLEKFMDDQGYDKYGRKTIEL